MQVDFCETSVISSNKPFFPPTPPNLREITGVPRHWFHLINSPPLPSRQFWKHRRQGLLRLHRVGGWGGNQRQDATGQMENRGPPPGDSGDSWKNHQIFRWTMEKNFGCQDFPEIKGMIPYNSPPVWVAEKLLWGRYYLTRTMDWI